MANEEKDNLVLIGAKVKPPVRDVITAIARSDDRSLSRTIARLLESHPEVVEQLPPVKPSAAVAA